MKRGLYKNFLINKLLKRYKVMFCITYYVNTITFGLYQLGLGFTPTIVQFTLPTLTGVLNHLNPIAAYHRRQWRKAAKRLKNEN